MLTVRNRMTGPTQSGILEVSKVRFLPVILLVRKFARYLASSFRYFDFTTRSSLVTDSTEGTWLTRMVHIFLSVSLSTTP